MFSILAGQQFSSATFFAKSGNFGLPIAGLRQLGPCCASAGHVYQHQPYPIRIASAITCLVIALGDDAFVVE